MIKVDMIFQKPFAGITCLDHTITPGCKGVWESQESGKGDWLRSLQPEIGQSQHLWSSGQEHRMIKKHVLTLQADTFTQHGRSGGNLESPSFSEFQARMRLLALCPSSFSILPCFLPVPQEDSHTSKPCLSASCKQLPFRHSSSLGMWAVAALLGEWVRGQTHSSRLEVGLGLFGQGILRHQVPTVWARWAHPLGLVDSSLSPLLWLGEARWGPCKG